MKRKMNPVNLIGWLFTLLLCVMTAILFYVIFLNSIKPKSEVFANIWALPQTVDLSKFPTLWQDYKFSIYTFNSFFITAVSLVVSIYIAAMVAYGIAKFQFKGNGFMYLYFILGLMFPIKLGVVPLYILVRQLGLNNTLFSMILIYSATISIPVFVLTGFFRSIPTSIIEAARIDGASQFFIFNRIILPLAAPALGSVVPMVAVNCWNDFFLPMIFLTRDEVKTVPLGLMKFVVSGYFDISKMDLVFAAAAISLIPIIIIYLACSKQIIGGVTAGAVKM